MKIKSQEMKLVSNILRDFYFDLLKSASMPKSNGIIWIIHQLWKLKINVYESLLPNFLDQESKQFLFKYAQMEYKSLKIKK
jgi:hypothetical protein